MVAVWNTKKTHFVGRRILSFNCFIDYLFYYNPYPNHEHYWLAQGPIILGMRLAFWILLYWRKITQLKDRIRRPAKCVFVSNCAHKGWGLGEIMGHHPLVYNSISLSRRLLAALIEARTTVKEPRMHLPAAIQPFDAVVVASKVL